MATIDATVKRLQDKVDEAKKGVRATMTVEELSRESIRDIIKEVGEANALATALFDREDDKLGVTTRHLRTELTKLVEEGGDASKERLKEIEQRAKDISTVAAESESPEEQAYLGELAANVQGAARKARGAAAGLDSGGAIGESLFTGIFGQKFGKWMLNAPEGGNKAKRSVADLRLEIAEAQRDEAIGGGDAGFESEKKEEEREAKIRETDVKHKEDTVISLLHQILSLIGRNGRGGGGLDTDGDGDVDADDGGGGLVDTLKDVVTHPATIATAGVGTGLLLPRILRSIGLGGLSSVVNMGARATGGFGSRLFGGSAPGRVPIFGGGGKNLAANLIDNILHVGKDGTRVTMDSLGNIKVRNASGQFIKNQAAYLKNIGLPTKMPAGSTIKEALELAVKNRRLADVTRIGLLASFRKMLTPTTKGLRGAARGGGLWALPFMAYDAITGATEKAEQLAIDPTDTGTIGESGVDKAISLHAGAKVVQGLAWLNSLLGQDIGTTEEIGQGLEAAFVGIDMSKQWDMQHIILPAMRERMKKDLEAMAGGHSLQTTLGRRLFYSGQLMRLLFEKDENPSMDSYKVWNHDMPAGSFPKAQPIASAVSRLINQTAWAIADDEANTSKTEVDPERVIQIKRRLQEGRFSPLGGEGLESLIPQRAVNQEGRVSFRSEMIHNMVNSGGNWQLFESSISPKTHIAKVAARGNVDAIRALGANAELSMYELTRMYGADRAASIYQNFQDNRVKTTTIADTLLDDENATHNRHRTNVGEVNLSLE